ncbi:type IV conjugative transfer system lipoprotein TraV [Escherichia coli]|uniref:type IV conjugative transfer system lipoprotein TraV n=1 Tax=Escherichia coli TaxID=562 RepID=UPI0022273BC4|nr:type IV conjugative transfer system lipoprotein TraV [Escherichia coli]MCW3377936.1 type IV conjugative transfer system lipoprotein TraV [Escherichia coli]
MKQISLFIPLLGTLLLSGCTGTNSDFECDATTSDTCMTMEQAMRRPKTGAVLRSKPAAASLPRLADGNFRTTPVQAVAATTPSQQACCDSTSGAETAGTTPAVYGCP